MKLISNNYRGFNLNLANVQSKKGYNVYYILKIKI